MTDVLCHRGPDGQGIYSSEFNLQSTGGNARYGVALGHRRLAVIDVAGGQQPISNEDQTVWVILNGEIFSFQALKRRLMANGHVFSHQHGYRGARSPLRRGGCRFRKHLNGMFAIAVWDNRKQRKFWFATV